MSQAPTAAKAPIVFSHANSYPSGTYRLLLDTWRAAGHAVYALDKFGHDPRYPVTSNWPHLRDQLVDFIERTVHAPVYLVGHSLGGMLSLMAAARKPELALGVVLLDAPVISGWRAHGVHMAKFAGLMERLSPSQVARIRRHHWPDKSAVHHHFAAKSLFARWDPRVLADYVHCGFEPHASGVSLGFDREVEARIYDTIPHHLGPLLKRHPPRCAVGYIGGQQSVEARHAGLGATHRLVKHRFKLLPGTHLFPMEHPIAAAEAVLEMLRTMPASQPIRGGPAATAHAPGRDVAV